MQFSLNNNWIELSPETQAAVDRMGPFSQHALFLLCCQQLYQSQGGTPPDATPKVPQLNNLPKDLDEHGGDRVAAAIPAPPPIRDTSPPPGAAAAATPSPILPGPSGRNDPLEQQLSALEDQFRDKPAAPPATRGEKVPNDRYRKLQAACFAELFGVIKDVAKNSRSPWFTTNGHGPVFLTSFRFSCFNGR